MTTKTSTVTVEVPVYRHADGDWVPAVELEEATARAVIEYEGGAMVVAS